jgi:eukaryotic-like serine/threonine-protein kinase
LLHQITSDEPRELRRLDAAIPVELETIVLKAIGKTPAERYATAQELADDLQRFLEDRPILARRPTLREKATKWARRHRSVVTSAVTLMVLTMLGSVITTVIVAQKAHEAAVQRARAEENFRKARQAVDQLVTISEREAGNEALEVLRWRLLEAALSFYQDFLEQSRDDLSIQRDLQAGRANMQTILGQLITLIGSYQYIPLHDPHVQDEIRLSDDQRREIDRMQKNWGRRTFEAMSRGPGERERQRLELALDQEKRVAELLQPEQLRRFKQIARQYIGPLAFMDPEVVNALGLTTDQKNQLRAILDEAGSDATKFGPGRGPRPRNDAERRVLKEMLGVLSEEQRRKWDELTGEPFQFGHR